MKNLFLIISLIFGLAFSASAQTPGKYYQYIASGGAMNGGTNNIAISATNTTASFDVSEYHNFGVQLSFKGVSAGTSTVQLWGYQSIDNTTFETTPSLVKLIALNGTTTVCTNLDITVYGASNYKFILGNTNETVAVTNVVFQRRFKAPFVNTR